MSLIIRFVAARFVAAALVGCLAVASSGAVEAAADGAPVTVFYDAQVFTAEPAHPFADAIAIRGGSILAVGALPDVERIAGADAQRVDLHGRFLMPGMIDAHAHPIDGGKELISARYPDPEDSIPGLVQFVAEQIDKQSSRIGDVVVIYDLDLGFWSHAADIDAVLSAGRFAKQPILLFGSDGHTGWANRVLRTRAGLTARYLRKLKSAERGYYGFAAGFEPNGFVVDVGLNKIAHLLPPPSAETLLAAGRAAVHYMNSLGITGWLDAAAAGTLGRPLEPNDQGVLPAYRELARLGELTAHVDAYAVVAPDAGFGQIDLVQALQSQYAGIPNFRIPGLKVFADGVVEYPSQTAALTQPYLNTGKSIPLYFTPAKMNALVTEADRRGLLVHVHAIGDLAVKATLDAFAAARTANPEGRLPFTLTHAQFVDPADILRFAELRVIAALQLLWAVADPVTIEPVKPYVAADIYRWMYPARSLLDSGTTVAGASDWPVSSANPFAAIYQAETRVGPLGVLDAAQRMPRDAMLYAYTRNAAQVLEQSAQIGSLAPGKQADLVLVDRDVLTVSAEELKDAKVLWTMLAGKIVYGTSPF